MYQGQKKQIHPKVFLYKSQNSNVQNTLIYTFKVEVKTLKILEIECDFTGSTNITIKEPNTSTLVCTSVVKPFLDPVTVARLQLLPEWRLKTKFRLTLKPPSKQDQLRWIDEQTESIKGLQIQVKALFDSMEVTLMKFQDVQSQLQRSKMRYFDLDFPPVEISILGKEDRTLLDDTLTQWLRPVDYLSNQPYAISYKIDPNTLQSGKLGHESFYSVLRCLAHKPALIQRLFSNINQVNQTSIYKLYLCNNGQWQSIIVDDFFPCQPVGQPKYIKSSLNQIWPNLIEKAYAKTFNSYFSLRDLSIKDVFEDLTGYPTSVMPIDFSYDQLKRLQKQIQNGCLVSLYTTQQARQFQQDDFNSIANRAYLLQKIKSDMTEIYVSTEKGIISMEIDQAKEKFKMACVCNVAGWQQIKIPGTFIKVQHSTDPDYINFVSKWYYAFDLSQQTQMSFCLRQQDIHIGDNFSHKPYLQISLILFKRGINYIQIPLQITNFSHDRSIYIDITLPQGSYILIPITISQLKSTINLPQKQLVNDIFRKLDLIMTRQLKYPQIKTLCNYAKQLIDQQKYQTWLKKYTKLKGFGISAFRKLWNDYRVLWKSNLQQFSAQRLFILSFHSKKQISMLLKNTKGTDLDNQSHVAIIRKYGNQIKTKYKEVKLFILKNQFNPITYFVENISTNPVEVELDCSKSNGYSYMPLTGKSRRRLEVSQCEYLMRLIPDLNGTLNTLAHHQELSVRQCV